jgi:hypothetical protein
VINVPDDLLTEMLAVEAEKATKLEVIFGAWWRHYAVPYEFVATLYQERSTCPYCGEPLGALPAIQKGAEKEGYSAHLDHMDPLSRGGEDSIRNTIYVCRDCNLAKGRQLFSDWLRKLPVGLQESAYKFYEEKHGHALEAFVPGRKQVRLTLTRIELSLDEAVLRRLFPKPIVSGPPARE